MSSRKRKLEYTSDDNEDEEQNKLIGTSCESDETKSKAKDLRSDPGEVVFDDNILKQLNSDLKAKEEYLRKLKLVKMYREKNNLEELGELIAKWRDVCHQALQDLQELLPSPRPSLKELLDHLQVEYDLIHFDPENESFS